MYFFIIFMLGTFGLIYLFFKNLQSQEQSTNSKTHQKQGASQEFIDIEDENDMAVNPYKRSTPLAMTSHFTSSSTPFVNLATSTFAQSKRLKNKSCTNSLNNSLNTTVLSQRDHTGCRNNGGQLADNLSCDTEGWATGERAGNCGGGKVRWGVSGADHCWSGEMVVGT